MRPVRELVDIARKVTGLDIPVRVGPRRPGDPPALAQARLGWSPRYADMAVQMAHAWSWRQGGRGAFQRPRTATSG